MIKTIFKSIIMAILPMAMIVSGCRKQTAQPTIGFASYDIDPVFVEDDETGIDVKTKLTMGGSVGKTFQFTLKVPSDASALVSKYNEIHGTGYELLPEAAYAIGTAEWAAGKSSSSVEVRFYRNMMGDASYILPIQLDVQDATVSSGTCYLIAGKNVYTNPVIMQSVSDPTIVRGEDGYFYLAGTEEGYFPPETQGMPLFKSRDLVSWEWEDNRRVFETRPNWPTDPGNRGLWAPELRYINGKYVCYYSWVTGWGDDHFPTDEVGVAVSDVPEGPYTDLGELIDARTFNVLPSIDPFYFEDGGKKYLFWGSEHIYVTELEDDGLSVRKNPDGTPVLLEKVSNDGEGACVYKRGEWYYLFSSTGSPLDGAYSTYHVRVARSSSITGPYVNKMGQRLLDGKYELFISGDDFFIGTGHNSVVIHDDAGQTWIALHSYIASDIEMGHPVSLEQIYWDSEGWPYVRNDGHISRKALAPVIKNM